MLIEETTEVTEKDEGFTLVELLIVIVILGILATIVVFAVRGITDKGQENACKATAKTYEIAIETYYANFGNDTDPDGDILVASELLRSYDDTNVEIVLPAGTETASQVRVVNPSDCQSITL